MNNTTSAAKPLAVILLEPGGQIIAVDWHVFQSLTGKPQKHRPDGLKATMVRELADGPRRVSDLKPILLKRWGPDQIKVVRQELGVVSTHLGGWDWSWSLPDASDDGAVAHVSSASSRDSTT